MKKILALVLAMLMVMALCACGDTAEEASPAEDTAAVEAAPAEDAAAPAEDAAAADDSASGEASDEDASAEQSLELFPMDGYDKTFEGYIAWVQAALESQTGNPNLESDLAALAEVTEDTYDASVMPFAMQIQFGLISTYEDFLAA